MKDVYIVSITKQPIDNCETLPIYKCIHKLAKSEVGWNINFENSKSLAFNYNQYISDLYADKIIIFAHDDCIIEDLFLYEKLNKAMEQFDVVGLAGIKAPITIKEPALWHLMGDRSQVSGAVAHFTGKDDNERFMTHFGITPARVLLLDGVFLAINVEKCLEKGVRFDETNPARFHYYDLDFSMTANKAGLKLGTWPIWITHKSHGLTKPDQSFHDGQQWFIKKWS